MSSKEEDAAAEFARREEAAHRLAHPPLTQRLIGNIGLLAGVALAIFLVILFSGGLNG